MTNPDVTVREHGPDFFTILDHDGSHGVDDRDDDERDTVVHSREARLRAMKEHAERLWKLERVQRVVNDFYTLSRARQRAVNPLAFAEQLQAALDSEQLQAALDSEHPEGGEV